MPYYYNGLRRKYSRRHGRNTIKRRRGQRALFKKRKTSYTRRGYVPKIPRGGTARRFLLYNKLLAPKLLTTMDYCDTKTITAGSGMSGHNFLLNNIYDPDSTGIGHQPAFHDQWQALYARYRVISCQWWITFAPMRSATYHIEPISGNPYNAGTHDDMTKNPVILFTETADSPIFHFTEVGDLNFIRETSKTNKRVRYKMTSGDPFKVYHMNGKLSAKALYDNPEKADISANFGGPPDDNLFLRVGYMSKDGSATAPFRIDIRMRFLVELTEPKDVNES